MMPTTGGFHDNLQELAVIPVTSRGPVGGSGGQRTLILIGL